MRKILVDVDGVLANFVGAVCQGLQAWSGPSRRPSVVPLRYRPELFREYDMRKALTEREQEEMHRMCSSPGFCSGLEWYEGAKDWLAELRLLGHVTALTAPYGNSPHWTEERREWLRGHVDAVTFCHKERKADEPGDILIEDRLETCVEWSKRQGKRSIVVDRPWNQERGGPLVARAYGLPGVSIVAGILAGDIP
jgi:hypothetical protein